MSSAQSGGKRAPSAWTKFVTKYYHDQKKKNPEYKFSQALKDAAKEYKKGKTGGSRNDEEDEEDEDSDMEGGKKKRRTRRKKTTKKKRTSRK
jgi:hypothetical protein